MSNVVNENTPTGSATRHTATALAAILAALAAKRGIHVPGEVATEVSGWLLAAVVTVSAGISGALGALWRRWIG